MPSVFPPALALGPGAETRVPMALVIIGGVVGVVVLVWALQGEEVVGLRVRAKVVKNKVAPPFRQAEFDMMHDSGISTEGDVLDLALSDKVVERSGAWFSYGDMRLGQGRENARQFLKENGDVLQEIRSKVLSKHTVAVAAPSSNNGNGQE